jgi:hypothetical protein
MSIVLKVFVFLFVLIVCAKPAYAYIDPGTGSFIIQVLIAMFAAAAVALNIFWRNIKLFFAKLRGKPTQGKHE